jgi:hypothetical protein
VKDGSFSAFRGCCRNSLADSRWRCRNVNIPRKENSLRKLVLFTGAVILLAVAVASMLFLASRPAPSPSAVAGTPPVVSCPAASPVLVGTISVPAGPIAGYCQDRLINAAHIINAAQSFGIGTHTQAIGVMTAMGESGLQNLSHGDAAGADSRGLFQQRDNGSWGTLADRMTPYVAARDFFAALIRVPNWKALTPTEAAHTVQANQDANYYTQYWNDAVQVVAALNP